MLAPVVVRHLGKGIHRLRNPVEIRFGHLHRRQDEAAAHALDLEHRAEAREGALVEQALEPREQFRFAQAQRFGRFAVGLIGQRETALQSIDDAAIGFVQCVIER